MHNKCWQDSLKQKGFSYSRVESSFPNKKWFTDLEFVNRKYITTMIRMRTGHCLTSAHLYKINIKDNPNCECGLEESLDHIFFECPINFIPNFDIYQEMILSGLQTPLSIFLILSKLSETRIRILMKFLIHNKINL